MTVRARRQTSDWEGLAEAWPEALRGDPALLDSTVLVLACFYDWEYFLSSLVGITVRSSIYYDIKSNEQQLPDRGLTS